jgi:hypothetical protein
MTCDLEAIEALVLGELSPERAAEVAAHAESCAACAKEREMLRAERALLARRAQAEPALPPQIWREVQRRIETPRRWWRWGAVAATAMAAGAAALVLAWPRPRPAPVPQVATAPAPAPVRSTPDIVLDAAEQQYRQAIAVLEGELAQARGRLAPNQARRWEKTFSAAREEVALLASARTADPETRVRALDGYAAYVRSLQTAVLDLSERRR